ncbi:GAD-like domain-containing protein [Providencia stuartii]|uniref:GAD-like protein n=1 Tax=Providencia stuartii ATCC 25827 TaxID=471874 RepID=A0AA86YPA5_PROST|nr:GAD-like protein [Providencia stuartii ATCC 25827]
MEKENKMRNEFFEAFIDEFGDATTSRYASVEEIEKWKGKLPELLLNYWRNEGWSSYYNGLFTIVNPEDYEDIVDGWLENTYLEEVDIFHAIAINGFGNVYLCGEKTGQCVVISPIFNTIFVQKKKLKRIQTTDSLNVSILTLFLSSKVERHGKDGLFDKAIQKFGPLGDNEIFGFEPALTLGGELDIKYIQKVDARIHLSILSQLADPEIDEINV